MVFFVVLLSFYFCNKMPSLKHFWGGKSLFHILTYTCTSYSITQEVRVGAQSKKLESGTETETMEEYHLSLLISYIA